MNCRRNQQEATNGLSRHHIYPRRYHDHWGNEVDKDCTVILCRTPCHDDLHEIIRRKERMYQGELPMPPDRYEDIFTDFIL